MRRAALAFVLSCAGCMMVPPDDPPDASTLFILPDAGQDAGVDGGSDGGQCIPGINCSGGCTPGVDCPPPPEGHGVGQLWLVRVDHGAANTATSVEALVTAASKAIGDAKVDLVGTAVGSLYQPARVIWAENPRQTAPESIARALTELAVADPPALGGCPADMLVSMASALRSLFANGVTAFPTAPAALFVGIVDEGARPAALSACPGAIATLANDPSFWVQNGAAPVPRVRVRIAVIATPESGTSEALRARCAATPGVPPEVIDVINPSALAYYGPLLSTLSSRAPGLSVGVDLCDAFGTPASVGTTISTWLSGLNLP